MPKTHFLKLNSPKEKRKKKKEKRKDGVCRLHNLYSYPIPNLDTFDFKNNTRTNERNQQSTPRHPALFYQSFNQKERNRPLLSVLYSAKITWCRGKYIPQTGDGDEYRDESRVIHPQGKKRTEAQYRCFLMDPYMLSSATLLIPGTGLW